MKDANYLTRFLYINGRIDFTAPIPVEYLAFAVPENHNPDNRSGVFKLSPNWTVRWHEPIDEPDHPKGFQLYHAGKEISILSPWDESKSLWEVFRRGDMIFRLDDYAIVKKCVSDRHAARIPPWNVIERYVKRLCPWCLPPNSET